MPLAPGLGDLRIIKKEVSLFLKFHLISCLVVWHAVSVCNFPPSKEKTIFINTWEIGDNNQVREGLAQTTDQLDSGSSFPLPTSPKQLYWQRDRHSQNGFEHHHSRRKDKSLCMWQMAPWYNFKHSDSVSLNLIIQRVPDTCGEQKCPTLDHLSPSHPMWGSQSFVFTLM